MTKILSLSRSLNFLFEPYGSVVNDSEALRDSAVDVVVFPGGPDVPPDFYNSKAHPQTYTDRRHYARFEDVYEQALAQCCTLVGICGGAQYHCVKAGGKLIQHVENHAKHGLHNVSSVLGPAQVTSTHHQMMHPKGTSYSLLAWAEGLSPIHEDGFEQEVKLEANKEPEAVWFRSTSDKTLNSLAVQWHPEYMHKGQSGFDLFQNLLTNYVF